MVSHLLQKNTHVVLAAIILYEKKGRKGIFGGVLNILSVNIPYKTTKVSLCQESSARIARINSSFGEAFQGCIKMCVFKFKVHVQ